MAWATAVSFILVLMVTYVPFLRPFFDTVPLTLKDWFLMAPFCFASPVAMEIMKIFMRQRHTKLVPVPERI
jgi:Ca2+-transporting ATPase